jgi:hypothetical protein
MASFLQFTAIFHFPPPRGVRPLFMHYYMQMVFSTTPCSRWYNNIYLGYWACKSTRRPTFAAAAALDAILLLVLALGWSAKCFFLQIAAGKLKTNRLLGLHRVRFPIFKLLS